MVYATGNNIAMMSANITQFITSVVDFLTERDLINSPEKSTVTLFTLNTKEYKIHPEVKIQGHTVRLEQNPKLLGVTFDTMFNFSTHIKNTVTKAKSKLNILKALAGSTWGQDKETIIITYKSIIRSTLEYAAPVWTPSVCPSNWERLESIQNQALRIASGCLLMSSSDHIHQECKVLPLKQHSQLLCKQYLAGTFLSNHPENKILNNPPLRNLKKTARMYKTEVSEKFQADLNLKQVIKCLHTDSVQTCLNNYKPNRVLQSDPPEINPVEQTLTRRERSELSRLRSGFSRRLKSYLCRIDNKNMVQDRCPLCQESPHDTNHLFNCKVNPTTLTVITLWTRPKEAATFLKLNDEEEI